MKTNEKNLPATLQKSYYGKAKTRTENDFIVLRSYDTDVVAYNPTTGEFKRLWNGWSVTTAKHINDFLILFNLPKISKREWLSLPCENPAPVYNVSISTGWTTHTATALLTATECESTITALEKNRPHIVAWYD